MGLVRIVVVALVMIASAASAGFADSLPRAGHDGLPGALKSRTADPIPHSFVLVSATGYGYTGQTLGEDDRHDRAFGSLALAYGFEDWLGVGLKVDGRYDRHSSDAGDDSGFIGDPRLYARLRTSLGDTVAAAVQATLWMPGASAPSIVPAAVSPELVAALTHSPTSVPLAITANLGYRIDSSAKAYPDLMRFSPADQLALGISESNSVLASLAAVYALPSVELLAEWNLDWRHQADLAFRRSPMHLGLGARVSVWTEAEVVVYGQGRLSRVPTLGAQGSPVPVEPLFMAGISLQTRFGSASRARVVAPLVIAPPPVRASVTGRIEVDGQPVAGAVVTVVDGAGKTRRVNTDAQGAFVVEGLAPGAGTLTLSKEGFADLEQHVDLVGGVRFEIVTLALAALPSLGQLRGVIQSFDGNLLEAELRIEPGSWTAQSNASGEFSLDLPPASYEVFISAPGFSQQTRRAQIRVGGVTILNVDLTK